MENITNTLDNEKKLKIFLYLEKIIKKRYMESLKHVLVIFIAIVASVCIKYIAGANIYLEILAYVMVALSGIYSAFIVMYLFYYDLLDIYIDMLIKTDKIVKDTIYMIVENERSGALHRLISAVKLFKLMINRHRSNDNEHRICVEIYASYIYTIIFSLIIAFMGIVLSLKWFISLLVAALITLYYVYKHEYRALSMLRTI